MKEERITVIAYHSGVPAHLEELDNTLKAMQEFVGGHIECVTGSSGRTVLVCNEEGVILDLPHNRGFRGDFFVAGVDGDEFASVPADVIGKVRLR